MTDDARRVVHAVRSDSFAGVERYVCDVSGELLRRGWEVAVVGGDPKAMRQALPEGARLVPATTTAAVLRALVGLGRTPLVHAHMTAAETASVASRPVTGARVVATRHFAAPRGGSTPVRVAGRLVARGISREVAISRFVASALGGEPLVLLNGVPNRAGRPDPASRTVLVIQRLQAEKDTETAVRAFALSGLAADRWTLQVTGRGPLLDPLRQLASELGIGGATEFLGFVDDPGALRHRAAAFLATAPAEPFGLSVAEAMAAGLPVVAADGGAHGEVLGDTGLVFPAGDAAACAVLLRRLAHSPETRAHLGERAQDRQRRHLSLSGHVDRLEALYAEVLGAR